MKEKFSIHMTVFKLNPFNCEGYKLTGLADLKKLPKICPFFLDDKKSIRAWKSLFNTDMNITTENLLLYFPKRHEFCTAETVWKYGKTEAEKSFMDTLDKALTIS